jgi:hypothetical protein
MYCLYNHTTKHKDENIYIIHIAVLLVDGIKHVALFGGRATNLQEMSNLFDFKTM